MISRNKLYFLVLLFLFFSPLFAHKINKIVSIYYCEEEVDGKTFAQKVQISNGDTKKIWAVDGKQISEDDFNMDFTQARAQELLKERQEQEEIRMRKQQEVHTIRASIEKQEHRLKIKDAVEQIKKSIDQIKENNLEQYYKFDESTIASKDELDKLCIDDLEQAQGFIEKSADEIELDKVQEFSSSFVPYSYKIQQFFLDSVKNAVNNCNDTRALKGYLQLLS